MVTKNHELESKCQLKNVNDKESENMEEIDAIETATITDHSDRPTVGLQPIVDKQVIETLLLQKPITEIPILELEIPVIKTPTIVVHTEDKQVEEMPTMVLSDCNKSNTVIVEDVRAEIELMDDKILSKVRCIQEEKHVNGNDLDLLNQSIINRIK